jgi:hypothetical protein
MPNNKREKMITLHGIIIPCKWDRDSKVTSVAVSALDENEYVVENDAISAKLMEYINSRVIITGKMTQQDHDKKKIKVKNWEILVEPKR